MSKLKQYGDVQVMTADRVQLIIMLYDGVIRFNKSALKCMDEGDVQGRNHFINRSHAIIAELTASLDMERGGEISGNLLRLYRFVTDQLNLAHMKKNKAALHTVNNIINELKAGWVAISEQNQARISGIQPQERVSLNGI